MEELISIIIPIYNVEKFIRRTIISVINQDYKHLEIILVDDGSPDSSPKIIDEFACLDNRIISIHKENGGVSSARNAGLKIAKGKYVVFIDGDDWVDQNYVSYLYDLVKSQSCLVGMNLNNYSDFNSISSNVKYTISNIKAIEWIYLERIFVAVWNKIYSIDLLKKNNICFDETIWYGEGMLFNIDCLQFTDKVAIGEKCVYHQVSNPNSAMRKFNVDSNLCGIRSLEIQKTHWKIFDKRIDEAWNYHRRAFNFSIVRGLTRANMEKEYLDLYNECIYNLKHNLRASLIVDIPLKSKVKYICFAIAPKLMLKREKLKD